MVSRYPLFCAFLAENQGEILFFEFYALFLQSQMGADQPLSLGIAEQNRPFRVGGLSSEENLGMVALVQRECWM